MACLRGCGFTGSCLAHLVRYRMGTYTPKGEEHLVHTQPSLGLPALQWHPFQPHNCQQAEHRPALSHSWAGSNKVLAPRSAGACSLVMKRKAQLTCNACPSTHHTQAALDATAPDAFTQCHKLEWHLVRCSEPTHALAAAVQPRCVRTE